MKHTFKKMSSLLTVTAIMGTIVCASTVSSSAVWNGREEFSGAIGFEIPEVWKDAEAFYVHVWATDKADTDYQWQTEEQKMTWEKGDVIATYSVPEGPWNLISISALGIEKGKANATMDTQFSYTCIGDTAYLVNTSKTVKNYDEKRTEVYEMGWLKHPDITSRKTITADGKVVGKDFLIEFASSEPYGNGSVEDVWYSYYNTTRYNMFTRKTAENYNDIYKEFVTKYNPENKTNGTYNGTNIFAWDSEKTGKTWEEAKQYVIEQIGITPSDDPTPVVTPTQPPTEAPTLAPTQSLAPENNENNNANNNNGANTVTGKVVNTDDNSGIFALGTLLVSASGIVFVSRKRKHS